MPRLACGESRGVLSKLSQEIVQGHPKIVQTVLKEAASMRYHNDEIRVSFIELSIMSPRDILYSSRERALVTSASRKVTELQNKEDFFIVAHNLANLLRGSHKSFAYCLNDVIEVFLAQSNDDIPVLSKRLLFVLYDCFQVACESNLWVKVGLLLCAIAVVQGASYRLEILHTHRMILFHDESFKKELLSLLFAGHDEFSCRFIKDAIYYSDVA